MKSIDILYNPDMTAGSSLEDALLVRGVVNYLRSYAEEKHLEGLITRATQADFEKSKIEFEGVGCADVRG